MTERKDTVDIDRRASLVFMLFLLAGIFLGCEAEVEISPAKQVEATVSEAVSTVVVVTWLTDDPTVGYVEYGVTEDLGMTTPQ
jgi:hypothetical protein